jgi:ABC-2 type transporter
MLAIIVGTLVGTLFWQTTSPQSIVSAMFQSMFYASISQMVAIGKQFPERSIFYKHQDANFFPTWCYVFGKSIASIPLAIIDALFYGTLIYFFVGLAINDGASVANYFMFLLILFTTSLTTGLFFMVYSASVRDVTIAQAAMALTTVVLIVFCGFTVQPDVIPAYYIWIYWINFFAWSLRGIVVNEFQSGKYDSFMSGTSITVGAQILTQFGFVDANGEPFSLQWAVWGLLVTFGWAIISMITSVACLKNIRFATGASLVTDKGSDEQEVLDTSTAVAIPFTRVDLTFTNIHYTVVSSITKEELTLLNGIDGFIESGKMTALMGSSGARSLGLRCFCFCCCCF